MKLSIGDYVVVTSPYKIDYSDIGGEETVIPAGSFGVVISPRNTFPNGVRIAVFFSNFENYHELWYEGESIGPGHYIGIECLEPLNNEIDSFDDIESLNILFG